MGFDLHGMNPKLNKPMSEFPTIEKFKGNEDKWTILDKDKKLSDKYWKEKDAYDEINVGNYFRNNCWWWRPLWHFVCSTCEHILTEKQMDSGNYNDGCVIEEKQAKAISKQLTKLDKEGLIAKHEVEYEAKRLAQEERNDKDERFAANYPFSRDNILEFAKFCKESGGFEIW